MDGRLSPERIARVITHYDPDIVALQELDEAPAPIGLDRREDHGREGRRSLEVRLQGFEVGVADVLEIV